MSLSRLISPPTFFDALIRRKREFCFLMSGRAATFHDAQLMIQQEREEEKRKQIDYDFNLEEFEVLVAQVLKGKHQDPTPSGQKSGEVSSSPQTNFARPTLFEFGGVSCQDSRIIYRKRLGKDIPEDYIEPQPVDTNMNPKKVERDERIQLTSEEYETVLSNRKRLLLVASEQARLIQEEREKNRLIEEEEEEIAAIYDWGDGIHIPTDSRIIHHKRIRNNQS